MVNFNDSDLLTMQTRINVVKDKLKTMDPVKLNADPETSLECLSSPTNAWDRLHLFFLTDYIDFHSIINVYITTLFIISLFKQAYSVIDLYLQYYSHCLQKIMILVNKGGYTVLVLFTMRFGLSSETDSRSDKDT